MSAPPLAPLDDSALNPFSRSFASLLFAEFPWLRAYALAAAPRDTPGSFTVRVPSQGDPCGRLLEVTTNGDEVTICFAFLAHTHSYWPDDDYGDGPLALLHGLFDDSYLAEDSFRGRNWCGSSFPVRESELEPEPGLITVVSSWSGRADRVIDRTSGS